MDEQKAFNLISIITGLGFVLCWPAFFLVTDGEKGMIFREWVLLIAYCDFILCFLMSVYLCPDEEQEELTRNYLEDMQQKNAFPSGGIVRINNGDEGGEFVIIRPRPEPQKRG